jgi:hypothetical protein
MAAHFIDSIDAKPADPLLEQRGAGHDHTRRTETALHGIMTDERSLHGMQLVAGREAFDGGDLVTGSTGG